MTEKVLQYSTGCYQTEEINFLPLSILTADAFFKVHSQVQFLATESSLKIMKNAFYFTLKALFIL